MNSYSHICGILYSTVIIIIILLLMCYYYIAADCPNTSLLLNQWYMDDGVLAGLPLSVSNALNIIHDMGPTLGLHLNPSKCELFNRCNDFKLFPPEMKTSTCPNLDILGSPIGDAQYCSSYIASKCSAASNLYYQRSKRLLCKIHM